LFDVRDENELSSDWFIDSAEFCVAADFTFLRGFNHAEKVAFLCMSSDVRWKMWRLAMGFGKFYMTSVQSAHEVVVRSAREDQGLPWSFEKTSSNSTSPDFNFIPRKPNTKAEEKLEANPINRVARVEREKLKKNPVESTSEWAKENERQKVE
jgi:hypothetical protein